jgi:hypothetical protein
MEVFSDTFIPAELTRTVAEHCPRCIWPYLRPVTSLDETHFLCLACGHCFRRDHGQLRPVNALTCHGCSAHSKRDCITLLQHEFPRFSAGTPTDNQPAYT